MFSKLNREVRKVNRKKDIARLSEQERKQIEQELIFGNILENLEVDFLEEAYTDKK